jgi:hypothetical protein
MRFKNFVEANIGEIGFSWSSVEGEKTIIGTTKIGEKDRLLIKVANSNFTQLLDPSELEKEVNFDTKNLEQTKARIIKNKEREEAEKLEKAKEEDTNGFADNLSPINKAKVLAALNKQVSINKNFITQKEFIHKAVQEGAKVVQNRTFGRVLQLSNGGFFSQADLTKIALDYAEYLIQRESPNGI